MELSSTAAPAAPAIAAPRAKGASRWWQVVIGIVCMSMIANLQYGWTLFVLPIHEKFGWSRAEIQVAFTIFVLMETWLLPVEGWIIDKVGAKKICLLGGFLVGLAWVVNSFADTLPALYLGAIIAGAGGGMVYATCIGNTLKWFPDHRGLALGLISAGFGAGAALTVAPIASTIQNSGYQSAFLYFGLLQGGVIIVASMFLAKPPKYESGAKSSLEPTRVQRQFLLSEALRQPVFWLLYAISTMVLAGGLMAVAQLAPIARDYQVDKIPVSLFGLTMPALLFALTLDRVMNGICRPFFGWVSDKIGREQTMFIAFMLEGFGILGLLKFGAHPLLFVILTGLVFFAWGEITTLVPATATDAFGTKNATAIAGAIYTSKGVAVLLVPLASLLVQRTGNWELVFIIAAVLNIAAALIAIFLLKPLRRKLAAA
ncbi:MAG: putative oxalate/formate antiporter [Herbaspirillum sp.]|jgi:OFA family oxalate/formate antiporter-like MFS transporter|nr:putative oxalate/formate antiporter [Herbaspirillum sp.]